MSSVLVELQELLSSICVYTGDVQIESDAVCWSFMFWQSSELDTQLL